MAKNDKVTDTNNKKPFNKQEWRDRRHNKKYKVQKWEDRKKRALEHKYKVQLKKEGIVLSGTVAQRQEQQKLSRIKEAQLEFEQRKQEQGEARQRQEEKKRLIQQLREKRAQRSRKLKQKTRKGQPLMGVRMEMLQEKIQKMVSQNKI